MKEIGKKHFHLKEQGINYQRLLQKNNICLYFGCSMQLKLVGEIFCHLKTVFFGQKWSEIENSLINLWWLNTFTNFSFSRNQTLRKVDVLPFLTVSSSLGLLIVCKFEEWKRFAKFLVGKPTLPKLHMV